MTRTTEPANSETIVDDLIPRDTSRSLPIALLRARETLMIRFRPMLAKHGFTEQQWRVLRVLMESGQLDASTLAERACILAPSLTRILRTLQSKGLLERTVSEKDGRQLILKPTEHAYEVVAAISPESRAIYQQLEKKYGKQNLDALVDMLNELID